MPPESTAVAGPTSLYDPRLLPVVVATLTTTSLAAFDGISVVVALPKIAADLGDVALLPWVVTAFLLTSAIATLAAGPAIDGIGLQQSFRVTVVFFAVASAACAFAPTLPLLVLFRALQGLGGGMVMAISLSAIGISIPQELRSKAYVAVSLVWGGFSLAGPAIAAVLMQAFGWRSIFLVNVPLCAIALVVGWNRFGGHVPELDARRFDYRGLGLLAAFTTAALLGISRVDWWALVFLAVAAAFGTLYWRHSGRVENPVLERRFFSDMPFVAINLGGAAPYGAGVAITSYFALFVEGALHRGSSAVSFGMILFAVGWCGGSLVASRVLDRIDAIRAAILGSLLAIPSTVVGIVAAVSHPPDWLIGAVLFGIGAGIGLISPSLLSLIQSRSRPSEIGRATAAHQYVRTMSLTFATGIMGAVLLAIVQYRSGAIDIVQKLLAGHHARADVAARAALASGFQGVLVVALVVMVFGLGATLTLRRWQARQDTAIAVGMDKKLLTGAIDGVS